MAMNKTTPQVFTQISEMATRAPAEQTATWTPPCSIIARIGGRRQRGFTTAINSQQEHQVDQVDEGDGADGHGPAPGADGRRWPDGPVVEHDPELPTLAAYTNQSVMALTARSPPLGAGREVAERYGRQQEPRGEEDDPDECGDLRSRRSRRSTGGCGR